MLSHVAKIHGYKGKQELYLRQKPVELDRLVQIAKVQSTEASNRASGPFKVHNSIIWRMLQNGFE